jgi:hypothetical protein
MSRPTKIVKSERNVYEPEMREEDVLLQIRQMLEINGALVFRSIERVPKCYRCGLWLGSSERGIPDLSGLLPVLGSHPVSFYLEVKKPKGGVLRPAQVDVLERIRVMGAISGFVRSWEEVKALFVKHGIGFKVG